MPEGIIVFGVNGSGKSTLGHELAHILNFKHMDIEDYHFQKSEIPYTEVRTRDDCLNLMLADIEKHGSFVLSAVTGDFGEKIMAMYNLAVYITVPTEIRRRRIEEREYERHGERVREGGDMFEQQQKFLDFAMSRSLMPIEQWLEKLTCPVLRVDGTKDISENVKWIVSQYLCRN